jgi:hypothetical protein
MTNRLAIILGLILLVIVIANAVFGWQLHIALGRRGAQLIEYMAFWR